MAYQATVLNVMIASPSDVAEERQLVRDAIYEWNAIHSKQFGVMLNPVGWETHVAPEMGTRPQEIINKRILNEADILIGIFWTRLGTETGEYVSGTVEEISKHIASNKLTSIYICDKHIRPSQINDQYQKLQEQIKKWRPSGVLEFYDDLSTFKQKLKDHLTLHIQENEYIQNVLNDIKNLNIPHAASSIHQVEPTDEMVQILIQGGDNNGEFLFKRGLGQGSILIGNKSIDCTNQREISLWEATLEQLVDYGLLKDIKNQGIHFTLTQSGWKAFDQLKAKLAENK